MGQKESLVRNGESGPGRMSHAFTLILGHLGMVVRAGTTAVSASHCPCAPLAGHT